MNPWIKFSFKVAYVVLLVWVLYRFGGDQVRIMLDLGLQQIKLLMHEVVGFFQRIVYKFS